MIKRWSTFLLDCGALGAGKGQLLLRPGTGVRKQAKYGQLRLVNFMYAEYVSSLVRYVPQPVFSSKQ